MWDDFYLTCNMSCDIGAYVSLLCVVCNNYFLYIYYTIEKYTVPFDCFWPVVTLKESIESHWALKDKIYLRHYWKQPDTSTHHYAMQTDDDAQTKKVAVFINLFIQKKNSLRIGKRKKNRVCMISKVWQNGLYNSLMYRKWIFLMCLSWFIEHILVQ